MASNFVKTTLAIWKFFYFFYITALFFLHFDLNPECEIGIRYLSIAILNILGFIWFIQLFQVCELLYQMKVERFGKNCSGSAPGFGCILLR